MTTVSPLRSSGRFILGHLALAEILVDCSLWIKWRRRMARGVERSQLLELHTFYECDLPLQDLLPRQKRLRRRQGDPIRKYGHKLAICRR